MAIAGTASPGASLLHEQGMLARIFRPWLGGLIVLVALLLLVPSALAALTFPALTGRVVDEAGILSPEVEAKLTAKLADLEAKTTNQLVVVTLKSLGGTDIADYGYQLGRHWQIGQKGKNNGVLLIVAPEDRAVRIEVGYGLEGDLTDAVSRLIIENAIIPRFRAGDMPGGIEAGVDDIVKVVSGDAAAFKERAAERPAKGEDWRSFIPVIFFLIIFIIIILSNLRRRGRRGPWGWTTGSGWSSGSSSGWSGGSSGGGFSGGGGSFGGGGASGRW
ncbi:MAG: TPM domain-containing protein [Bauldia sp.]